MKFLLHLLGLIGIAMLVGLGLSYLALERGSIWGTMRIGPWTAWKDIGSPNPDPYTKAYSTRSGAIVLARAEGISFVAERDSDGKRLLRQCSYRIDGNTPEAAFWTLFATLDDGTVIAGQKDLPAIRSSRINRAGDGSFTIRVGPDLAAGNWLEMEGEGNFNLVLTFYDSSIASGLEAPGNDLPSIIGERCSG